MAADSNESMEDGRELIRQVRQRLESLQRAGLTAFPRSSFRAAEVVSVIRPTRITDTTPAAARIRPPVAAEVSPIPGAEVQRPESADLQPRPAAEAPPMPAPKFVSPAGTESIPVPLRTGPMDPVPPAQLAPMSPEPKAPAPPVVPQTMGSIFRDAGFESPLVLPDERPAVLSAAAAEVAGCTRCPHLATTRTQTVYGCGTPTARLMFIGEAPGADEDRIGQPFVGRAGQLLTDMITKGMGLRREEVYIANILKCRPPDNRTPTPEESNNCSSYLEHQIAGHPT